MHIVRRSTAAFVLIAFASVCHAEIAVSGRVVSPGGQPLADAEVLLLHEIDPVTRATLDAQGRVADPLARARTDARGSYQLAAPSPGAYVVRVSAAGHVPVERHLWPLLEPIELTDAVPAHDVGLSVRVSSKDGKPVSGASVRITAERSRFGGGSDGWSAVRRSATTTTDGTARLPRGEDEDSLVSVSAAGHLPREISRARGTAVTLRLEPGVSATVEAVSAEGKPVAKALVATGRAAHPLGFTDAAGRIAISVPETGTLRVKVATSDGRETAGEVAPPVQGTPRPRRFTLPAIVRLTGEVVDAETTRPVGEAIIYELDAPWSAVLPDGAGGFAFELPAGRNARVVAGATGYLPSEPLTVRPGASTQPVSIALRPAAAIEGTVVDAEGTPVSGASVALREREPEGMVRIRIGGPDETVSTRTSASGRFRLAAVDPSPTYDLVVRAEAFARVTREMAGLEPRRTRSNVRVELARGQAVTGRVVDPEGRPLRDASVVLSVAAGKMRSFAGVGWGGDRPEDSFESVSDDDGFFRIAGLTPGAFDLEAKRSGFAKASVVGIEVPASVEPIDVGEVTLEPGVTVQGLVLDPSGSPVEGAEVRLSEGGPMLVFGGGGGGASPDAVTGPDGWFAIDGQKEGTKIALAVGRTGYVTARPAGIEVPSTEPVRVTLQPSSKVSGTVVDPDGKPIAGADVTLTRSQTGGVGGQVIKFVLRDEETADDRGRFVFEEVEPGTISLGASAPEWQEAHLDGVPVPKGEDVDDIEIRLEPGAIVEGQVVAPDGRPAIGARVGPLREGGDPIQFGGSTSDGKGRFRLEGLAPGPISIEATHESYVRTVKDLEARPGRNTLRLVFEGGQTVEGSVTDAAGAAVPGAWVRLATSTRAWGGPETLSGADGSFTLKGVADGSYELRAGKRGYAAAKLDEPVRVEGQPVAGLIVRLDAGAAITGTVRGVDPERLGEIVVRAFSTDGLGMSDARVDRQGAYRLEDASAGRWVVTATIPSNGRETRDEVTVEPGATEARLDLDFGTGLTLSGRVTRGGVAVAGAAMFAQGIDVNSSGGGRTDAAGAFEIGGLDPGSYRLDLHQWDTGLSYGETVELTTSRDLRIEIPTARIVGRVVDASDRQAISGASVMLRSTSPDRESSTLVDRGATTDLNGRFEIGDVADGAWRLDVSRSGYGAASREVTVRSGRDVSDVRVELDPTEGLTLEVMLPSGRPADEVTAAVLDAGGRPLTQGIFAAGEGGRVRLPSVPAGTWEVLVRAGESGTATQSATAPGRPVPVTLPPACTLTIVVPALAGETVAAEATVTDASGRPFRSIEWFSLSSTSWRLSGGRATITALPPGRWTVAVKTADGRSWSATATTSPGPAASVTLE